MKNFGDNLTTYRSVACNCDDIGGPNCRAGYEEDGRLQAIAAAYAEYVKLRDERLHFNHLPPKERILLDDRLFAATRKFFDLLDALEGTDNET